MWPTRWEPQVLAALIAALASLILTVYEAVARRRGAARLEALKAEFEKARERQLEYLRKYLELMIDGKVRESTAFREMLSWVQRVRDELRSIFEGVVQHHPPQLIVDLNALGDGLAACFATQQGFFSEVNCASAHALKTECLELIRATTRSLEGKALASEIAIPEGLASRLAALGERHRRFREAASRQVQALTSSLLASSERDAA